ncbi:hypothetical protein ES703_119207 [subsurface metagenome]
MSKQKSKISEEYKEVPKKTRYFSKKANFAFHTIARIEAGSTPDRRIETVKKMADALDVSLDDLVK